MIVALYARALQLLLPDQRRAAGLVVANLLLGALAVLEPVLFGRVVDALNRGLEAWPLIAFWALRGAARMSSGTSVSLLANRMAHRRRLAAMT